MADCVAPSVERSLSAGLIGRAVLFTVLVVDDDPSCREGLTDLLGLQTDLHVVGVLQDKDASRRAAAELAPDAVVVDLRSPSVGLATTRCFRTLFPGSAIICLGLYAPQARLATTAGADAFVPKDTVPEALVAAIRAAIARRQAASGSDEAETKRAG